MYYFELRRIVRKYMRKRSLPKRPSTYDEAIRKKMFVVFGAFLVAWSLAGVYIGKNFLEKEDEEGQKYVKKPIDVLKGTIDTTRAWETLLGPRISKSELDVKKPYELDD